MRAAKLTSPRLQRVLALLDDGQSYSTLEIVRGARVCAVNSIISELRERGAKIACERRDAEDGRRWYYTLTARPEDA